MKPAKLDTAAIFERLIAVYRAQFTLLFPAALIVFAPVAILEAAALASDSVAVALVGSLISLIATFWLMGMVIEAVRDIQDGRRDFQIGELFASVRPVLGRLILVGVLAAIGIFGGLLLLIVPGLILLTLWALVAPVVVIERPPGTFDAFGRSRKLVSGNGFRVFGVIVVAVLIQFVLSGILSVIFGTSAVGSGLSTLLGNALAAPISAIAVALMYLELRTIHGDAPPPAGVEAAPTSPFGDPAPATSPFGDAAPAPDPLSPERPPGIPRD
jgi:hypothetical protein